MYIIDILTVIFVLTILYLIFWKFYFLRNPKRNTPKGEELIISPADGKVIEIFKYQQNQIALFKGNHRLLGIIHTLTKDVAESGYVLSIFMTPLDVHYNRAPISGKIIKVKHNNGKFLAVNNFKAGLENEKTEILIKGKIKMKMIQIAGFLARRIETNVKSGDTVSAGQEVGLINLGSQVTLILPESVMLKVSKGDRVVAGETILAKINS